MKIKRSSLQEKKVYEAVVIGSGPAGLGAALYLKRAGKNVVIIEKEYEEKYIDILSNSTSDDYVFFTDYLERNKERLDSINNF